MSKKKLIICITIIFILMICTIFIIYIVKNKDKQEEPITNITEKKNDNKKEETNKEKTIKEDNKTTIEKEEIKEEVKEKPKDEVKQETKENKNTNSNNQQQQNNNNNNNNNTNTNPTPTPTPTPNPNPTPTPTPDPTPEPEPIITYYCPDGYNLEGAECTSIISADYVCPNGTYDYSNEGIPRDTYCVNLSEGYESEDTCPEGYGSIAVISLGAPTINKCFPLHRKIYVCNDGYNLNGTSCVRTINAEIR